MGRGAVHLDRLVLVGEALTGRPTQAEVLEIVLRQAMVALDAEGGVAAFVDDDGMVEPVLLVGYTVDTVPGFGPLTLDRLLPITFAAREHESVWVPNLADGLARFPALADAPTASQAWAAIPLLDAGEAFAAISVSFTAPHEFVEAERSFLEVLAHVAALSLRRSGATHPSRSRLRASTDAPIELAVLDEDGVIVEVNDAWLEYGRRNGADLSVIGVGASYLDVCDRAGADPGAVAVATAIRAALRGELGSLPPVVIDCPFPTGESKAAIAVSPRRSVAAEVIGATVIIMAVAR